MICNNVERMQMIKILGANKWNIYTSVLEISELEQGIASYTTEIHIHIMRKESTDPGALKYCRMAEIIELFRRCKG